MRRTHVDFLGALNRKLSTKALAAVRVEVVEFGLECILPKVEHLLVPLMTKL